MISQAHSLASLYNKCLESNNPLHIGDFTTHEVEVTSSGLAIQEDAQGAVHGLVLPCQDAGRTDEAECYQCVSKQESH